MIDWTSHEVLRNNVLNGIIKVMNYNPANREIQSILSIPTFDKAGELQIKYNNVIVSLREFFKQYDYEITEENMIKFIATYTLKNGISHQRTMDLFLMDCFLLSLKDSLFNGIYKDEFNVNFSIIKQYIKSHIINVIPDSKIKIFTELKIIYNLHLDRIDMFDDIVIDILKIDIKNEHLNEITNLLNSNYNYFENEIERVIGGAIQDLNTEDIQKNFTSIVRFIEAKYQNNSAMVDRCIQTFFYTSNSNIIEKNRVPKILYPEYDIYDNIHRNLKFIDKIGATKRFKNMLLGKMIISIQTFDKHSKYNKSEIYTFIESSMVYLGYFNRKGLLNDNDVIKIKNILEFWKTHKDYKHLVTKKYDVIDLVSTYTI